MTDPAPLEPVFESAPPAASLRIGYARAGVIELLADPYALAVIGFGDELALPADPRALRVGLQPVGEALREVWRVPNPIRSGREGALAWSSDGDHGFFALELDEAACGGIGAAAEAAYRQLADFVAASATPHLLRLWNYFDAINEGEGDAERYRRFCVGRARGLAALGQGYPAACAIGRRDRRRSLQVFGLAGRRLGRALENPRQTSAWRYPREYGPTAPTFARGMLDHDGQLLVSGTAAVVGYSSRHPGDFDAQLAETLDNLDTLRCAAGRSDGWRASLKVYLRDAADAPRLRRALAARLAADDELLLLEGDICRRELLVEIDGAYRRR